MPILIQRKFYDYAFAAYKTEYLNGDKQWRGKQEADTFEAEEAKAIIKQLNASKIDDNIEYNLKEVKQHIKKMYYIEGAHHPAAPPELVKKNMLEKMKLNQNNNNKK